MKKYSNLDLKKVVHILFVFISLASCRNENLMFIGFEDFNEGWIKNDELSFSFESDKSNLDFNLTFRTDSSYPFSNIFLISTIKNNNNEVTDTIEYYFENNESKWYELKISGIKNSKILIRKALEIYEGNVNVRIKHSIRYLDSIVPLTKLDGILDVGLIVEKSLLDEKI